MPISLLNARFSASVLIIIVLAMSELSLVGNVPARAAPGWRVDDGSNLWAPYGPNPAGGVRQLQLQYYNGPTDEFNNFVAGKIDVTDWPQPKVSYGAYDANPDFQLSPPQPGFEDFGIYYNGLDTTWAAWGCDWTVHMPYASAAGQTSPIQTYTSQCGIDMRQAFAHLLDRPAFVQDVIGAVGAGAAQALADPSPPIKNPAASTLWAQCGWDQFMNKTRYGLNLPCISAYNIQNDPGGFAVPGSPDFCMAADHMIAAGIASGATGPDLPQTFTDVNGVVRHFKASGTPGTCKLTGLTAGVLNPAFHIKGMIRNDPGDFRLPLGIGFQNAINMLFQSIVVTPTYGDINALGAIVFTDPPESTTNDWSFYTFGYNLAGPLPDHLFALYESINASDQCGGPLNPEPTNPTFVCIPAFDTPVQAASQTVDPSTFTLSTLQAFDEYGKRAVDLSAWSFNIRIAALTSVTGLVNERGASYPNFWTLLNARNNTIYTPTNSNYIFVGGNSSILRYGQASSYNQLNIFHASPEREFQLLSLIYDTVFTASPIQIGNVICWMGDMGNPSYPCTTFSVFAPGSANGPCPGTTTATCTQFSIQLRNNLKFQDGQQVKASDIAFSLLNIRQFAPTAGGALHFLENCPPAGDICPVSVQSDTQLQVYMKGASISFTPDMEAYVIPQHVWQCDVIGYGRAVSDCPATTPADYAAAGVNVASPTARSTSYDPVTNGALIGSGPFACISVFGAPTVGTGCIKNADGSRGGQAIPIGGTAVLQAYDFTRNLRTVDPFQQYMRSYNTDWGTGSNPVAAQSGQFQEFSWADVNDDAQVTIVDEVSVAACWKVIIDTKIKYVDSNADNIWNSGEPVVYDSNGNDVYDFGEQVIAGTPTVGQSLKTDSRIKFWDSNGNTVWDAGESVVYDLNNNKIYDSRIKFGVSGTNTTWVTGEAVVYDSNNNYVFDFGEPVIAAGEHGTPTVGQALKIDGHVKFEDANSNNVWDPGEAVVYDSNITTCTTPVNVS